MPNLATKFPTAPVALTAIDMSSVMLAEGLASSSPGNLAASSLPEWRRRGNASVSDGSGTPGRVDRGKPKRIRTSGSGSWGITVTNISGGDISVDDRVHGLGERRGEDGGEESDGGEGEHVGMRVGLRKGREGLGLTKGRGSFLVGSRRSRGWAGLYTSGEGAGTGILRPRCHPSKLG